MQDLNRLDHRTIAIGATLLVGTCGLACRAAEMGDPVSPDQQQRQQAIRAQGTQASLTVFPVVMGNQPANDVADVVALLLEQAGMTRLERTDTVFQLPAQADFDQAAALFGAYVQDHPIQTDYALYGEFVGTPATGPAEIRGLIVDRAGESVWADRQTPADRAFKKAKPDCPMTCCVFLAERVRTQLGIPDAARDESGEGKFARKFASNSPGPGEAEWAAMAERQAVMKKAGRQARLAVYPVRLSDVEVGEDAAIQLARLLTDRKLLDATAVESSLRIAIQPARNEQKLLWDLARAFQDHVKRNPPDADYVLLADYIRPPGTTQVWAVHFVVCTRSGEWVIVDFQNEHHGDFKSVDPQTLDDCGRLVARRLKSALR